MKTLRLLFGVGALVALLGMNVVLADIKDGSATGPEFPLDAGDGVSLKPITFESADNNAAQTTCATTPGGPSLNPLMEMPIVPLQDTEQLTQYDDLSPLGAKDSKRGDLPGRNSPNGRQPGWKIPTDPKQGDDPPSPTTPEPATMLLVGLGIGGAAVVARRRLNNKNGR